MAKWLPIVKTKRIVEVVTAYDAIDTDDALVFGDDGQIAIEDTIDTEDKLVVAEFQVADSIDTDTLVAGTNVDATHSDSVKVTDQLNQIMYFKTESSDVGDGLSEIVIPSLDESLDATDDYNELTLVANKEDSVDVGVEANETNVTADIKDSLDVGTNKQTSTFTGDAFCDSLVSNTGFTSPELAHDASTTTGAVLSVTQSSGLLSGSSASASGTIVVALPNSTFVPSETYVGQATFSWGWDISAAAGLQSGNSASLSIEYSLDDGASWTVAEVATTIGGTGDNSVGVTVNASNFNKVQFRAVGSVTSGTRAIVGEASQSVTFRYGRVQFSGSQV